MRRDQALQPTIEVINVSCSQLADYETLQPSSTCISVSEPYNALPQDERGMVQVRKPVPVVGVLDRTVNETVEYQLAPA